MAAPKKTAETKPNNDAPDAPDTSASENQSPATGLEFTPAAMPKLSRPRDRKPTRFDAAVAGLTVDDKSNALSVTVPASEVKKVRRELTSAGLACDPPRTVAWHVQVEGETAHVTFYAKTKVTKSDKSDESK